MAEISSEVAASAGLGYYSLDCRSAASPFVEPNVVAVAVGLGLGLLVAAAGGGVAVEQSEEVG